MVDKPDLTRIWAIDAAGADVVDPDSVVPGKFADGWESEIPPFEFFNYLAQHVTQGLAHINERGTPEHDATTQYKADISFVQGSDGTVYQAINNNQNSAPPSANWRVWPPPTGAATTSAAGVAELATNTEVQDGVDALRIVTPAGLSARTSTTSRTGVIQLATATEVNSGVDAVKAVTPSTLNGRTATTSRRGIVELATNGEATLGTDNERAVTPAGVKAVLEKIYPVGSIYTNVSNSTNPSTLLGFGSWTALAGRTVVGAGSYTDSRGENRNLTAGSSSGEYQHVQTAGELANHGHNSDALELRSHAGAIVNQTASIGLNPTGGPASTWTPDISSTGSGSPMNNMQPYIVAYMWQRTA